MMNRDRSYHHGDLRAALINEGLRQLDSAAPVELSLREIARNVGVSATAVYRHFPDKDALLAALADFGLALLAQRQRQVLAEKPDGVSFASLGREYVRFALAYPGLYRLIFSHRGKADQPMAAGPEGSAAWLLREQVSRALGPAANEQSISVTALRAWALVHGLAMLILDRQVDPSVGESLIDAIISVEAVALG